ncbi:MAG TPA: hypothetical protein VES95_00555 [Dermatophilaceae bacterium]|nr:hypothetical protein [Dermatophilaceae bacterium]
MRRAWFGGSPDRPLRHRGEAQTCHVLQRWSRFAGSWWVTDDREAYRFGKRQGLTTLDTMDLLTRPVADGDLSAQEAHDLLWAMNDADRRIRVPKHVSEMLG